MSLEPAALSAIHTRPSEDNSTKGLLPTSPRPLDSATGTSMAPEHYPPRPSCEVQDEHLPPRNPSRQVARWGPPPSEWGYDDREDRRLYGRQSLDYGGPGRGVSFRSGYHAEDDYWYGGRPYRRSPSVRGPYGPPAAPPPAQRPPPPPRPPRRGDGWEESSDDDASDAEPRRRKQRKRRDSRERSPTPEIVYRIPFTAWMNGPLKAHFVATMGEFVGTTMFLFFAFAGTQVANAGASDTSSNTTTNQSNGFSPIVLLYIGISFGFSLMVNVWIFFRISGGLFNPAVTLAMLLVKSINFTRAFLLLSSQLAGAIFSSFLVKVLFPTQFNVRTTISSSTSLVRGVFIEAVLTAELIFTIFMLAKEKHKATFMAPVGIGLALFVAELVGVYYTGGMLSPSVPSLTLLTSPGSLNPARSFGPCVVTGIWDREHWIYWVGPGTGALLAVAFYRFIKILEYEMANPGQDEANEEDAAAAAAAPKSEGV